MKTVMVDALFTMASTNPQAFRVGERNGHQWCHLWVSPGDPDALEALHALAARIGMRRAWFQNKPGFPHYDLTPGRRALAVRYGAVETDLAEWLRERRQLAGKEASPDA